MSMIVNRRDVDFYLYELLDLPSVLQHPRYSDYDEAAITAVLDTAQAVAENEFLPCAAKVDAEEPTFDGERVRCIPEIGQALSAYQEAGFFGAGFDQELGGLGLPAVAALAAEGMFVAANQGVSSYPFLTRAAANMLAVFGSNEQKETFLGPMLEGRWYGTMCLSEPQAGSSLSDIRTKATPTDEGHYLIEGTKMWISAGDHELAENIVEMVLAKIPGGPPGVKGISLFIVPKFRVTPDGEIGEFNNISLAGLNHKMGHRGTTNCLLNFGEKGPSHGYLVGEPHRGLAYMFHMMNEARIGVGYGSTMSGLAGYLYSLDYARNRPQGRLPGDKNPESPQVTISQHADVRRMLMAQKAYVEGATALQYYCTSLVESQRLSSSKEDHDELELLLEILTPIAKSWPSEYCLEANKLAIQVLGGYGYTRDYPVERFYRDNRLNHIHEGTHAIQGMDLLGRKVMMQNGKALDLLVNEIETAIDAAHERPSLREHASDLSASISVLKDTVQSVAECSDVKQRLANATIFLDAAGHVVIAWMWLKQAMVAADKLASGTDEDDAFYRGKLAACQFFYRYELPHVHQKFALVASLDDTCLTADETVFVGA